MIQKAKDVRITFFLILAVLTFAGIGYRLFDLAYLHHDEYVAVTEGRKDMSGGFSRGDVYIQSAGGPVLVATTKKYPIIYVSPSAVEDRFEAAKKISEFLELESGLVEKAMSKKNDPYEVLIRRASDELAEKVEKAGIKGLGVKYEDDRYYPENDILSHVLGFIGFPRGSYIKEGQYGVEAFYNNILAGPKEENSDIVLTIDRDIQYFAEKKLAEILKKWNSPSGMIIVQNPQNGAIFAMAASPSFDPNNYGSYAIKNFANPSVQDAFEPGSSFKPITMAAALDLKKINPATTYNDPGEVNISGYIVKNYDEKSHGIQTMTQVLENSLNTGAIFALNQIGFDPFLNYVVNFRFGDKTDIDLAGEIEGSLDNLKTVPKIKVNYATASFGQGISVTPIQLITAYSALANGGKLYRPYVVDKIVRSDGSEKKTEPKIVAAPITKETSRAISSMLVSVVDNGFEKAGIKGYDIAGKTGTAQIADPDGGYSKDFIHNFLGYAPAFDPKFVVLIKLDKPQGVRFASSSLSPVFREITAFLLNYFNVPPVK